MISVRFPEFLGSKGRNLVESAGVELGLWMKVDIEGPGVRSSIELRAYNKY